MARTAAASGIRIEYGFIAAGIAVAIIAAVNGLGIASQGDIRQRIDCHEAIASAALGAGDIRLSHVGHRSIGSVCTRARSRFELRRYTLARFQKGPTLKIKRDH
jgi:hypothetical protein